MASEIMERGLTVRQAEVYAEIVKFFAKHRYMPTIRELNEILGISSPNGTSYHLRVLRKKGYISSHNKGARAFTINRMALIQALWDGAREGERQDFLRKNGIENV